MQALEAPLYAATGIKLDILSQGTGQAIQTAQNGDADVLLVHSPSQEEQFIDGGYGLKRIPFMYNYFVIVGPKDDPAGIANSKDASDAFSKIWNSGQKFVSRGDSSGTNTKELAIWTAAGITPSGDNYLSIGKGMGDTLMMASEIQGYTLTDTATYLSMKDKLDLSQLYSSSADLENIYSLIPLNPEKFSSRDLADAQRFIDWMLSDEGQAAIAQYGVSQYGQELFYLGSGD